jgi:release factor glutamine methyltransferase
VNAELLSKFTLGCDRAYLDARPEGELSCEEGEGYRRALGEGSRGIPAAYITGHHQFWGMDFIVNSRCPESAPRETTRRSNRARTNPAGRQARAPVRSVRIVDVATGSGSIARAPAQGIAP